MTSGVEIVETVSAQRVMHGVKYETAVHILRPVEEVYRFCRDAQMLPTAVRHLQLVGPLKGSRTRWKALGPSGTHLQWDAEMVCQRENELLAWRSLPGSEVDMAGAASFEAGPDGHGTVLTLRLKLALPDSQASAAVVDLLGVGLEQIIEGDLERLKQFLETGDVTSGIDPSCHVSHPMTAEVRYRRTPK